MKRKAAVFQHVAFEDLGSFEQVLTDHAFEIDTFQLGVDDLARAYSNDPDLLIVLGGPISVNDGELFPFLAQELAIVRARLLQDTPTIGICLGAQLMSQALGGTVTVMPQKEIGWSRIALSDAVSDNNPLRILGDDTQVLHWHGETFSLPEGAVALASSAVCEQQAFAWKRNGLALQFHPEVSARALERWYIGHIAELSAAKVDIPALRAASRKHAEVLRGRGQAFLHDWLTRRGL